MPRKTICVRSPRNVPRGSAPTGRPTSLCTPNLGAVGPERREPAFRLDHEQTDAAEDQPRRLGENGGGKPKRRPADPPQPGTVAAGAEVEHQRQQASGDGDVGRGQGGVGEEARFAGQQRDRQSPGPRPAPASRPPARRRTATATRRRSADALAHGNSLSRWLIGSRRTPCQLPRDRAAASPHRPAAAWCRASSGRRCCRCASVPGRAGRRSVRRRWRRVATRPSRTRATRRPPKTATMWRRRAGPSAAPARKETEYHGLVRRQASLPEVPRSTGATRRNPMRLVARGAIPTEK